MVQNFMGVTKSSIEGSIVEGMLTTFVDKYNVAVEVAKVDPTKVSTVISNGNHNDYIKRNIFTSCEKNQVLWITMRL